MSDFTGLELRHAYFGGRLAWRCVRWVGHIGIWKPALVAVVCWSGLAALSTIREITVAASPVGHAVSAVCEGHLSQQCHVTNDGTGTQLLAASPVAVTDVTGWTVPLSWWLQVGAVFCTVGALTVAVVRLFSRSPARPYQRRGSIRGGIKSDWYAGQRHAEATRRNARRAGNWRARHRARKASRGEYVGDPTTVEAAILRYADPPKTRTQKKASKSRQKANDAALDREFQAEIARLNTPPERPRLDPDDGPPIAPGQTFPEADADRARTAQILADLERDQHERNGWRGYEPPPAPAPVNGNGANDG